MAKYTFWSVLVVAAAVLMIAGLRGQKFHSPPIQIIPDMKQQGKYLAQAPSDFFADGRADRPPVPDTVPYEAGDPADAYRNSGIIDGYYGTGMPFPVDEAFLRRGRQRYEINCAVCHGELGDGKGITSKYGLAGAANYHTDRLRQMPDGQIFNTITHGKGTMIGLPNIAVNDRWAIIAYLRVLQRSQNARPTDLSEQQRSELHQ